MAGGAQSAGRMQCVDIAKGIGMLCIIAGHLGRPEINHVVFTFHVPLFFLIGGYFFRAAPGVSGIAKRARRLLVPYALCAVSCSLGSGLLCVLRGNAGEAIGVMKDSLVRALYGSGTLASPILGIKMFGAIWFLLAMFWALVLYDRISGHRWASLVVLALFAVGLLTGKWWLPFSIQAGMCALLFVHIGHLARMHADRVDFRIDAISAPLVVASATAWAIAYAIGRGRFYLVQNYFECVPADVVGGHRRDHYRALGLPAARGRPRRLDGAWPLRETLSCGAVLPHVRPCGHSLAGPAGCPWPSDGFGALLARDHRPPLHEGRLGGAWRSRGFCGRLCETGTYGETGARLTSRNDSGLGFSRESRARLRYGNPGLNPHWLKRCVNIVLEFIRLSNRKKTGSVRFKVFRVKGRVPWQTKT